MFLSQKDYAPESEGIGLCIDDTEQMQVSYKNYSQALGGKGPYTKNIARIIIFLHTQQALISEI